MASEWKHTTIGNHFDLENGFAFKSRDFVALGIPVIKIKNIKAGYFSDHEFSYVPSYFLDNRPRKIARHNDLLISMSGNRFGGSPETWVGKVARYDRPQPHLINQRVGALRLKKKNTLDPIFMGYLLSSFEFQRLFISIATSSGGQANISPSQILSTPFQYPPLPVQQRIADVLGKLDDKIELNRRMNGTLEKMAAAIFKSWFIDFDPVHAKAEGRDPNLPAEIADLFPDSFEDSELGAIPEGWVVLKLGDLIELAYGKSLRAQDRKPGPVAVYGSNGRVGWHDTVLVPGPGIVVGRKGNPGIVTWSPAEFFPIDTTFYVVPIGSIGSLYFLFHALKNHNLASLGADSAVPGLNRNIAYMSQQVVPTSELVDVFDLFAKPISDRIYANERQNHHLAGLRDTLLPKLLSGEIELPEAEAIAEEVG